MSIKQLLKGVMLFAGLSDEELEMIVNLCEERRYSRGDVLAQEGQPGSEFYIVTEGFAEVSISGGAEDSRVVVNLGKGQIIGEMSLVDSGPRSATVRAISNPTVVQVIEQAEFQELCESNTAIGYRVMKDIAADLSFKLRHRNMTIG
jgi:CRP-like cAMP-binding protein